MLYASFIVACVALVWEAEAFVETQVLEVDWLSQQHVANHSNHDDHEYVMAVSGELVDAMLRRKGLSGFEKTIVNACGGGRRSIAYFSGLAKCLRDSKSELPEIVESFVAVEPNISVRNLIVVSTCCGVLERATACKEKLSENLQQCAEHSGTLEIMNRMHRTLIKHYCAHGAWEFIQALSHVSMDCARHTMGTITDCWGQAGLDYNDITSVLRRLTKREMLCQQMVGTQKCLAEFFSNSEACKGPMADMVLAKTALVVGEVSCAAYGDEGKDLRGL